MSDTGTNVYRFEVSFIFRTVYVCFFVQTVRDVRVTVCHWQLTA